MLYVIDKSGADIICDLQVSEWIDYSETFEDIVLFEIQT